MHERSREPRGSPLRTHLDTTAARVGAGFALFLLAAGSLSWFVAEYEHERTFRLVERQVEGHAAELAVALDQVIELRRQQLAVAAAGLASGEAPAAQVLGRLVATVPDLRAACLFEAGVLVAGAPSGACDATPADQGVRFDLRDGATELDVAVPAGRTSAARTLQGEFDGSFLRRALGAGAGLPLAHASELVQVDGVVLASALEGRAPGSRSPPVTPGIGRFLDARGFPVIAAASPVARGALWIRTRIDEADVTRTWELPAAVRFVSLVSVGVAVLGILGLVARGVTGPLAAAADAAERVAGGDFAVRVREAGPAETRILAAAINSMAAQLGGAYRALEGRVEARNRELEASLERERRLRAVLEFQAADLRARNEEQARHERALEEANHALAETNRALEASSRAKSDFLATMSHELRTPLNAVIGFSELLRGGVGGPLAPGQAEWADHIHRSGRHLLALIDDILDLARHEAGRATVALGPVDLQVPAREAAEMVRPLAEGKALSMTVDLDETWAVGDPRRLRQVALNLLANAVKFTPAGGAIALSVRGEADAAVLEVADDGIGIDPADHALVFEPFRQVDASLTRAHEGTGLGLALVHRFVEAMGGTVALDSRPGAGARFTVRLPRHPLAANPEVA